MDTSTSSHLPTLPLFAMALALLLVAPAPVHGADPPATNATVPGTAPEQPTRVIRLRRAKASRFTVEEGRFRRADALDPAQLPLPARVIAVSPRGYVQVDGPAGPLWLDAMDVVQDPPPQVKARCLGAVSAHPTRKVAGVSGAGEDC
ncbi:hypothetical protein WCE41_04110 [Luteimonas sp. MJ246]|uniref:hypothetical protein n=1 Tax=Luteimonas sp. MJ174 TaxID=3129237 RepID=UPI0031BB1EE1